MTWRELRTFVLNVPPESCLARTAWDSDDLLRAAWDQDTELLATIADQLAAANWQRGDGKGRQPDPYPRPR
jgi:hypothetical protein